VGGARSAHLRERQNDDYLEPHLSPPLPDSALGKVHEVRYTFV
jgi:hypothetical protein